jgi:hypothetical protein
MRFTVFEVVEILQRRREAPMVARQRGELGLGVSLQRLQFLGVGGGADAEGARPGGYETREAAVDIGDVAGGVVRVVPGVGIEETLAEVRRGFIGRLVPPSLQVEQGHALGGDDDRALIIRLTHAIRDPGLVTGAIDHQALRFLETADTIDVRLEIRRAHPGRHEPLHADRIAPHLLHEILEDRRRDQHQRLLGRGGNGEQANEQKKTEEARAHLGS